jgi:hypothetical protein
MAKMLSTINDIDHLRMIAVDIIKIGEGILDNLQIMTVPVKFWLVSGQIATTTIKMTTKGAIEMSIKKAVTTAEMTIDPTDKIVGRGLKGHTYHPRTS